jgi:uncharacterized membrane protein
MTIKQFQKIKLVIIVLLAMSVSQLISFKNYFLPIALMIVASLVLMFLKRRVKGVLADERDYEVAGKSALLAMQIYGWTSAISMFILYAFKEHNPAYEPIAITLAFSTCFLMLLYSLVFRYYSHFSLTDKKMIYLVVVIIFLFIASWFSIRFFSGEDDWNCQNGAWVKHGNPSFPAPASECK